MDKYICLYLLSSHKNLFFRIFSESLCRRHYSDFVFRIASDDVVLALSATSFTFAFIFVFKFAFAFAPAVDAPSIVLLKNKFITYTNIIKITIFGKYFFNKYNILPKLIPRIYTIKLYNYIII